MTQRGEHFRFGPVTTEGQTVRFGFTCSRYGSFTEEVTFSSPAPDAPMLLTLLQVALGVSTYKAAAAERVTFPPLTKEGRAMAEALYTEGLAEFFVRADLPYPPLTKFEGEILPFMRGEPSGTAAPLVAFGGGKDSYVAGVIVEEADGEAPAYASVVLSDAVEEVLRRTAPSELLIVRRKLDPELLALKEGFSGHVPITAINILILTIEGLLRGSKAVLFANERSADEPTMSVGGIEANHQYSKSSAFEVLVRRAVETAGTEAPLSYSVLRPYSELWIGRAFAGLKEPFGRFTSCNRNFRLAGDAERRWCGECAKCAFTSLILSPFLSREEMLAIFGENFLDRSQLQHFYRELVGLSDQKPWDCVGTIAECRAALFRAGGRDLFAETAAVRDLLPSVLSQETEESLRERWAEAMKAEPPGELPRRYADAGEKLT
ncbi:hypothetical protein [Parvularcula maris]|uniref:UDP-N-acetyl-alpha-D-muramoyl-L-alanyl-L-glutamate epimerase n=1 Tax=Parvularcula maris TaxID=2965077 RepID=A0A9X2RH89_9PROT|nr:hypothetical protein [Parvularcula maris]MCQ8184619.1 hypothetical protein [Parvularcula maris]